ncbi:MAG: LytR C-terminal domain-containing protein [Coriobacteriia bacterium]|nr:LytR C-terminal domain-containing protein [Coriobacteriia bacterium]MBN2840313.1 LytR C-terminal domain-containing protein [Coriobacteriia bacterium]
MSAPGAGWRASKRSSKLGKKVRREAKTQRVRDNVREGARVTRNGLVAGLQVLGTVVGGILALVFVLFVIALGVNAGARWLARQDAAEQSTPAARAEKAKENLLIIGTDGDGNADFLAVRLDEDDRQILGIAVPSGAFMEVPGQGFERVGDSITGGPGVSLAAISNYLSVPFEHYVLVSSTVYQDALTNQSLRDVMANVTKTDYTDEDRTRIAEFIATVEGERTALVPLPVKPIDLGGETFFEPQRDQIADLLLQWWDVRLGADDSSVRVIIYNGAGTPGIAGEAAQQMIAAGMRVVDTKNADRFDYETTMIVVQNGDLEQGEQVKAALGTGEVIDKPSEQDVADVIVIIGRDYQVPSEQ